MPSNAIQPDTPPKGGRKRLKAFDIDLLRRYTFEDAALERELLGLFLGQLPLLVSQLAEAKGQSEWHMAAHTLKGSARSVGAPALAELALELEQIGYQENPKRAKLAARVAAAVKAFETAIDAYYRRS
jgi:HPt (histidine-containing phosphotransfer) domain-containing protein